MPPLPAAHATTPPPPAAITALRSALPLVVALGLALVMQFIFPSLVGAFASQVALQVGIAIILAVSLNIVNGFTGQFSIGQAGFFALGAYAAASVSVYGSMLLWGSPLRHGGFLGWGEWLMIAGCLVGALLAAGLGFVVGLPSLRLRGDYLAIVTLGFGEIVRVLLQQSRSLPRDDFEQVRLPHSGEFFPPPLGGAQGFDGIVTYASLFWVFFFAAITCIAAFRLKQSSMGRAFLSIREDEIAARAMGVNITLYKVRAFVIAAFFAGLAGGLYGHTGIVLQPKEAGFQRSFEIIIMVVLGGLGSLSGVVLAAIILTVLPEILRDPTPVIANWPWITGLTLLLALATGVAYSLKRGQRIALTLTLASAALLAVAGLAAAANALLQRFSGKPDASVGDYRMIIYALMLITMMLVRPQGLFGVREIWDFFRTRKLGSKTA